MIIDTSALVAVIREEPGYEPMLAAMLSGSGAIPAPVIVELHRVMKIEGNQINPTVIAYLKELTDAGTLIISFTEDFAQRAAQANARFGSGNGRGGKLNMLDLMVYGTAKSRDMPILFTGADFPMTDARLHPASRLT